LLLDAFELIFVVVPIVLPPALVHNADAAWVGALVLLALQLGFLLPPLGYAVMMSSARESPPPGAGALARALARAIAVIVAAFALTAWQPRIAHFFDAPATVSAPALDEAEVERRMREMSGSRRQ
jgi:TRAP-type mannitol/chloroaromatic compound transport system permease large subunit